MRTLRAALARPSHAYLFSGPPNVGKEMAALAFAQALNCLEPVDGDACGQCLECRTIAHRNHPDVHLVEPSAAKGDKTKAGRSKQQICSVEDVRALVEQASWKAYRGRYKVFVLATELLNVQGANTLLKTIEEPEPGTVLVLTATSLDRVLPTLVSRCQPVPFGPVPALQVESWLVGRGVEAAKARRLARLADGRPGWAAQLAAEESVPEPTLLVLDDWVEAIAEADAIAAGHPDQEGQLLVLEVLISQARDVIMGLETQREDWIARPELVRKARERGLPLGYWMRVIRRLEEARHQVLGYANSKLLWTTLAGELQPTRAEQLAS